MMSVYSSISCVELAVRAPVVLFRVIQEGEHQLVDAHARVARGRDGVRRGFEFELEHGKRGAGFGGIVLAGKEFLLANSRPVGPGGAGAPGLFVVQIRGGGFASSAHVAGSLPRTVERFHSSLGLEAAPGGLRGKRETLRLKGFLSSGQSRG